MSTQPVESTPKNQCGGGLHAAEELQEPPNTSWAKAIAWLQAVDEAANYDPVQALIQQVGRLESEVAFLKSELAGQYIDRDGPSRRQDHANGPRP